MSLKESFLRAWKNKFSGQPPELDCLDETTGCDYLDIKAIEKNLQACNNTIAELNKQLQETEFVASFLWDLIHGVNKVLPSPANSLKFRANKKTDRLSCDLDNAIPIQGSFDSNSSTSPTGEISADYLQSIRSFYEGKSNFNAKGKNLPALPDSASHSPSFAKGNLDRKAASVDLDGLESQRDRRLSSNHYYSVVANSSDEPGIPSTAKPLQKRTKPMPIPRSSITKQNIPGEADDQLPIKPQRTSSKPSPSKPQLPISSSVECRSNFFLKKKLPTSLPEEKLGASESARFPSATNASSSWEGRKSEKDESLTFKDGDPCREPGLYKATSESFNSLESANSDDTLKSEVLSRSNTKDQRKPEYEEVIPVVKKSVEEGACVSTDDDDEEEDEPLYFNILLMQDRAKNKVQTWYSKGMNQQQQTKPSLPKRNLDKSHISLPSVKQRSDDSTVVRKQHWNQMKDSVLSSDSVRSEGSDSVFEGWKVNRSLLRSADSIDSQSDADDLSDMTGEEDGKLQMRKWIVNSILESENSFLCILDVLMKHMTTFRNVLNTPQVVISSTDIDTIFHKIPEIHLAHKMFVYQLSPKLENWSAEQQIAEIFKTLADEENKIAPIFIKNYPKAVQTIHKCWTENPQFAQLTKQIRIKNSKESPSIEELIHKPVLRFQRNSLVLHDLIKCTPPTHADYDSLQKTLQLSRLFLENLESPVDSDKVEHQRYLAKQGLVVEKIGNMRKLRHVFLFNDVLICARQKISSSRQKINLESKWYISLLDLSLDDIICIEEEKQLAEAQQNEIESLQRKMSELQKELKNELRGSVKDPSDNQPRQWSFHSKSNKNLEKVKKKMVENQAALIKASPCLMFKIHNRKFNRQHVLLMASDYERSNWRTTITGLLSRVQSSQSFSTTELQSMLNSQKISMSKMLGGLVSLEDLNLNEEHLFGSLKIKIFKLQGLKTPSDFYCTVEVDTFNQFLLKAKTKVILDSVEPSWNEEFEIELEGSQTLRILCYKMGKDVGALVGTCALELSKAWLRGDFQEKPISINDELSLTISLMYCSRDQTLKRKQSSIKGGLFGAPIKSVAKRECANVPLIVKTCLQEVECRGLDELGIYRVSGVSGEIQKLKKIFERSSKVASTMLSDFDIHVVTGILKAYFRELPEALFTDSLYPQFVKGMGLADPEAKEACITFLLSSLPEPNKTTAGYLIDHLIRVSMHEQENRMTLQNLATVFGPTLLRPAVREAQQQTLEELFSSGTREVMMQTNLLYYFLTLRVKNATS